MTTADPPTGTGAVAETTFRCPLVPGGPPADAVIGTLDRISGRVEWTADSDTSSGGTVTGRLTSQHLSVAEAVFEELVRAGYYASEVDLVPPVTDADGVTTLGFRAHVDGAGDLTMAARIRGTVVVYDNPDPTVVAEYTCTATTDAGIAVAERIAPPLEWTARTGRGTSAHTDDAGAIFVPVRAAAAVARRVTLRPPKITDEGWRMTLVLPVSGPETVTVTVTIPPEPTGQAAEPTRTEQASTEQAGTEQAGTEPRPSAAELLARIDPRAQLGQVRFSGGTGRELRADPPDPANSSDAD